MRETCTWCGGLGEVRWGKFGDGNVEKDLEPWLVVTILQCGNCHGLGWRPVGKARGTALNARGGNP